MTKFKLDNNASVGGTSFHGVVIKVDPKKLIKALGSPIKGDYKISGQWVFKYEGAVFCIYDWKETSLYDDSLPTPEDFWCSDSVTLHIGHMRETKELALELAKYLEGVSK